MIGGGEKKEADWKKFLKWSTLEDQLAESSPDLKQLQVVYKQFESGENGLDRRPFQRVSKRLAKYMELVQVSKSQDAEDYFAARLERLAQNLEAHQLDPDNETAAGIVRDLRWLAATGSLPELSESDRVQI